MYGNITVIISEFYDKKIVDKAEAAFTAIEKAKKDFANEQYRREKNKYGKAIYDAKEVAKSILTVSIIEGSKPSEAFEPPAHNYASHVTITSIKIIDGDGTGRKMAQIDATMPNLTQTE